MSSTAGKRTGLILALVLLVTFAAYAPALGNDFTMDDRSIAMGSLDSDLPNSMVHELQPLSVYFSSHYWRGTHRSNDLFRPITILSYALRHAVCGDNAVVAHAINILLHLVAAWLVFLLLGQFECPPAAKLLGTSVFALHALHSEVVVGVVGRAELFGFVFGLGACLLFARRRAWSSAIAALLLFLAFCSKESSLAWAPFLVVFGLAKKWPPREVLLRALTVVAVPLVVFLLLRARMLANLEFPVAKVSYFINPTVEMAFGERFCMGTWMLALGMWLCVAPFDLAADYSHACIPLVTSFGDWRFLLTFAVLACALFGGVFVFKRHRLLFLATATFFGFAFLTSNIPIVIGTIFGERLYYTPSLALSFVVAWTWRFGAMRKILLAAVVLWCGASVVVILQRNAVWKDDRTLFLHGSQNQPNSVRMLLVAAGKRQDEAKEQARLAEASEKQGRADEARELTEKARSALAEAMRLADRALEIDPEYAQAMINRGSMMTDATALRTGFHDVDKAVELFRRSLQARHYDETPDRSNAHHNIAMICRGRGQAKEAIHHYLKALQVAPRDFHNLIALFELVVEKKITGQRLAQSLRDFQKEKPEYPEWDGYLGLIEVRRNRVQQAELLLKKAIEKSPPDQFGGPATVRFKFVLADIYLNTRRPQLVGPLLRELAEQDFNHSMRDEAKGKIATAARMMGRPQ